MGGGRQKETYLVNMGTSKSSSSKTSLSQKINPNDNIISDINKKESNKSENLTNIKD